LEGPCGPRAQLCARLGQDLELHEDGLQRAHQRSVPRLGQKAYSHPEAPPNSPRSRPGGLRHCLSLEQTCSQDNLRSDRVEVHGRTTQT